jgi:predicted NAD-dependent protein-ADP-ribosyltransferase YbiA (DUF1768 family)
MHEYTTLPEDWYQEHYYQHDDVILFGKEHDMWWPLANVSEGFPLSVGSRTFFTTEGLYHACSFPGQLMIQRQLAEQLDGREAKKVKELHLSVRRKDWAEIKFEVMLLCLELKLSQHWQRIFPLLVQSGIRHLVEVSESDKRWGAVKHAEFSHVLQGCNWMGRSWEVVREKLKSVSSEEQWVKQCNSDSLLQYLGGL